MQMVPVAMQNPYNTQMMMLYPGNMGMQQPMYDCKKPKKKKKKKKKKEKSSSDSEYEVEYYYKPSSGPQRDYSYSSYSSPQQNYGM